MIQPIFSDIQPILSDTEPIFSRYSAAEPKNSTSIIDRERYSGRYLPTSASMLDADTWQLDRRCRMKSSAVRTARTMRRSAAPSLVARSAGRRGARRVERDECARRARRPRRGDEVDGRGDGDEVAERRRVRRARRDRALRRRRDEVLAGMLAHLGATPTRSAPDARAISRTISDAAENALPRGARGENARRARALTASGRPTSDHARASY